MANLNERRDLAVPYARAKEYLRDALQSLAESGEESTLRLHLTISAMEMQKDVIVTYGKGHDPMHFDEPWNVHWTPAQGGPYPDFDGTLTTRAAEDYDRAVLELQGEYKPPFGEAGKAFDAVVGNRIAANTAQTLLQTIARRMEERYKTEEAAKR